MRACSLRLTNVYGPRQLIRHNRQGFIGWFIRLAVEDREIQIYGDGSQLRDFVYVDDAADAFLRAGASDACNGEVFNVGGDDADQPSRPGARCSIDVAGSGRVRLRRVAGGEEGDRHRQLLRRLARSSSGRRAGRRACRSREGLRAHGRVLPRASRPVRRARRHATRSRRERAPHPVHVARRPARTPARCDAAIERVIDRGWFVLGPEVEAFEAEFAAACGAAHAVGVGTGTDALALIFAALGIGPGDEVITTPLSAAYTALAIMMAGARPVFADIDPDRLTLDPRAVEAAVTPRTAAILPVHLYGQPADMAALVDDRAPARPRDRRGLLPGAPRHVPADGPSGTFGVAGAFSFYPTKNLGALGDGGAVMTNDAALAERLKRLRNGGQTDRYHHLEPGVNSRLDEMQAAVLRARLPLLPAWTARRRALAAALPRGACRRAGRRAAGTATRATCITCFRSGRRSATALQAHLAAAGIETLIHYPVPIPRQPALAAERPADCPVADRVCARNPARCRCIRRCPRLK